MREPLLCCFERNIGKGLSHRTQIEVLQQGAQFRVSVDLITHEWVGPSLKE